MPAKCVLLAVAEKELLRTRVSEKPIDRQTDALPIAPARQGSDARRERLDLKCASTNSQHYSHKQHRALTGYSASEPKFLLNIVISLTSQCLGFITLCGNATDVNWLI